MPDLKALEHRMATLESRFGSVNLGDWSNDQDVPWYLAPVINPAALTAILKQQQYVQATIVNAMQLMTQIKLTKDPKQADVLMQTMSEIIDDWCPTYPHKFPRPHNGDPIDPRSPLNWSNILKEITQLAETLPEGSIRRDAAFELSRRLLDKASGLNAKTGKLATV